MPKKLTVPLERQSSRAGSSPNLPSASSKIKSVNKPACRPPIRSTSSAKTTPTLTSTKPVSSASKALENIASASAGRTSLGAPVRKALIPATSTGKSNKYSHVKTTIPKCSTKK